MGGAASPNFKWLQCYFLTKSFTNWALACDLPRLCYPFWKSWICLKLWLPQWGFCLWGCQMVVLKNKNWTTIKIKKGTKNSNKICTRRTENWDKWDEKAHCMDFMYMSVYIKNYIANVVHDQSIILTYTYKVSSWVYILMRQNFRFLDELRNMVHLIRTDGHVLSVAAHTTCIWIKLIYVHNKHEHFFLL